MVTKKVKSTARFGSRYGLKTRKRVQEVEKILKQRHPCPFCKSPALRRKAAGIWQCRKCAKVFAGGAYAPRTGVIKIEAEKAGMKVEESVEEKK